MLPCAEGDKRTEKPWRRRSKGATGVWHAPPLLPSILPEKYTNTVEQSMCLGRRKRKSWGILAAYSRLAEQLRDWVNVPLDHWLGFHKRAQNLVLKEWVVHELQLVYLQCVWSQLGLFGITDRPWNKIMDYLCFPSNTILLFCFPLLSVWPETQDSNFFLLFKLFFFFTNESLCGTRHYK